jgi:hypothetical protein
MFRTAINETGWLHREWAKSTNHSRRFTFDAIGSVDRAIIDRMRSMLRQAGEQATRNR